MRSDQPDPHRYRALAPYAPDGDLDLEAIIPGQGPLELEIGYGRGQFLFERAQSAPDARIVGIEIKRKWAYVVKTQGESLGLTNLTAWCGDAREVLERCEPGQLRRVFMNFPDPWWKKRHQKRLLTGEVLLDAVARVLAPGGEFFVQTDVEERGDRHLEALTEHAEFTLAGDAGRVTDNSYGARSNREVRAEADGLPIYRTLAIRR